MRRPLLAPLPYASYDAKSYYEYCKSLLIPPKGKNSKSVPDITITWSKTRTIIRLKRTVKQVSEQEIEALALEYSKTKEELMQEFANRKIAITNQAGELMHVPTNPKSRRAKSSKDKADAKPRRRRRLDQV